MLMEQQENIPLNQNSTLNSTQFKEVSSESQVESSVKEHSNNNQSKNLQTRHNDTLAIQPQDIGLYDDFVKHMKHVRDINDVTAILRSFPIAKLDPDSYIPVNIPNDDEGNPILDKDNFLSPVDATPGVNFSIDPRMQVARIPNPYLVSVQTEVQSTIVSKGRQMYRNAPYTSVMHYPLQIGDYQLDSSVRTPVIYPLARWLYRPLTVKPSTPTFQIISIDYYEEQLAKNETTFTNLQANSIRDGNAIYLDLSSTNGITSILGKLGLFECRNIIDLSNSVGRDAPVTVTPVNVDILDYDIARILDDTLSYQDIDMGLWFLSLPILSYTDYDPTHWKATTGGGWVGNYGNATQVSSFPRMTVAIPPYNQAEAIISYFFDDNDHKNILSASVDPTAKFGYVFTDILLDYRLLKTFAMQECLKAKGCISSFFIMMFPHLKDTLRFACLNIKNYDEMPKNITGLNDTHTRMLYGELLFKSGTQTTATSATGPLRTEIFFPANIPYEIISQYEPEYGAQEMKYLQCRNKYNGYIENVVRPASQVIPKSYTVNDIMTNPCFKNIEKMIYSILYLNKLNTSAQARMAEDDTSNLFKPIAVVNADGTFVGMFPNSTRSYFNAIHTAFQSNPTATTSCFRNFDSRSDIITTKLASNNFHTSFSDYKTY